MSSSVATFLTAALWLAAAGARAEPVAASASLTADAGVPIKREAVVVLAVTAPAALRERADGVASLLGSRLATRKELKLLTQEDVNTLLGLERQKALIGGGGKEGCDDSTCMTEVSGALGARYVVSPRIDQFGSRFLLTATLFDSTTAVSLAKPAADAASEEEIPAATEVIAREILLALGLKEEVVVVEPEDRSGFLLGLKIGNNFLGGLRALNPGGDLELGYRFNERWEGAVQVGFTLGRGTGAGAGAVSIVPSMVSARRSYRTDHSLRPYWSAGLGIQLGLGDYLLFQNDGVLPSVYGGGGLQYFFADRFSVGLDGNLNVAQLIIGVVQKRAAGGLNVDLSASLSYRF